MAPYRAATPGAPRAKSMKTTDLKNVIENNVDPEHIDLLSSSSASGAGQMPTGKKLDPPNKVEKNRKSKPKQPRDAKARRQVRRTTLPRDFHGDGPPLQHFLDKLNHPFDEHNRREYLSSPGAHSYDLHISDYMELEIRRTNMPKLTDAVIRIPAISLLCIPDHLYRGDSDHFPTEDLKTLETLRLCSGLFLAPGLPPLPTPITINRPALHRGVKMSIKSKDFVALTSLLKLEEYCIRFGTQVRDHIYLISEEHFIRVARLREHPIKKVVLFRNLLRASAESVPPMSEEVIAWNNKNKTRPACKEVNFPKFAHWLSDFMLDLPNDVGKEKDQMKRQLFTAGDWIIRVGMLRAALAEIRLVI
ncbi:hypothetical protein N7470_007080 [Penicillium chermesinum]|nr:hypothetical protein N7470_007080 [Penicillium chermesinum]